MQQTHSWHNYMSYPADTFLQKKEKLCRSLTDQCLSMLCFYKNIRRYFVFCGHNILTEGVFGTPLSSNARISVQRIVWVTISCCFRQKLLHGKLIVYQLLNEFITFHRTPEGSLPCVCETATTPCSDSIAFTPHFHTLLLWNQCLFCGLHLCFSNYCIYLKARWGFFLNFGA